MKIFIFLLTFLIFQQNLVAQQKVIGKVEYYKSFTSKWKYLVSTTDSQIHKLNSRNHKLKITQCGKTFEIKTDTTGIFQFRTISKDTILIEVNMPSKIINQSFLINPYNLKDTLKLRISDKRVSLYLDSIQAPDFYKKYNENQARLDFESGNAKIISDNEFTEKKIKKLRKSQEKKFGFNYVYLNHGCFKSVTEKRIAYRYNAIMKELLGIKNVW